ncbi:hypothetical protein SPRI_7027 [Streptomyces pristinaespiralis]|uniref:Uncharacterized protein n=1 Tax=Streptomyces pristinaespiralis TaxID=38300 RepID=A0A0M3QKT6_STRPR|nr:hypothetical protein SPRI_7027 [Streptomyces pristinaespiralis]
MRRPHAQRLRPCQVNPPAYPALFLRLSSRSPNGIAPRADSVHRRPPATRASGRGPRRARGRRGRRLGRWRVLLLRAPSTQAPGSASRPAACRTGRRSRPLSWSSSSSQRDRTGRWETAAVREACFWQYRGRPSPPQGATRRNRRRVADRREGARYGASRPALVPTCHSRRLRRLTATAIEKGRDLSFSMAASWPDHRLSSAAHRTDRPHFRCRSKNRHPSSSSNHGVPVCPPGLACNVFSLLPKASNSSRAR